MVSDIIMIDNQGHGFEQAINEARKAAEYQKLNYKQVLRIQMITEEMLCLARSVTGEMQASFWLEAEGKTFDLHMTTRTVMDKEKRRQLIATSSSRRNEITCTFLGKLRNKFEDAITAEADYVYDELPAELAADTAYTYPDDPEWDGYERSILQKAADDIKIAIRGSEVSMTVTAKLEG